MAITCSKCGEELLGAVNRCWKCGHELLIIPGENDSLTVHASTPTAQAASPVSSRPLEDEPVMARIVRDEASDAESNSPSDMLERNSSKSAAPPSLDSQPRCFGFLRSVLQNRSHICEAAAIISLVAGLFAIGIGAFFGWLVILGVIGLTAGLWGMASQRRGIATVGILCCLLGMTISSVRLSFDTYNWLYDEELIFSDDESSAFNEDDLLLDLQPVD